MDEIDWTSAFLEGAMLAWFERCIYSVRKVDRLSNVVELCPLNNVGSYRKSER